MDIHFIFIMLKIRFQRVGRKKTPTYRLVASDQRKDTQGKHLEILGNYNPVVQPKVVSLHEDRIRYWLSVGAELSESVRNLLINQGIISGEKAKSVAISNKRRAKIEKKKTDAVEATVAKIAKEEKEAKAKAKAAEEAKAAEAAAKAAADAPVEEPPVEAPVELPVELPVETPAEAPAETPAASETAAEPEEKKEAAE